MKDSPARHLVEAKLGELARRPLQVKYLAIPGRENRHPHALANYGLGRARRGRFGMWSNEPPFAEGPWFAP